MGFPSEKVLKTIRDKLAKAESSRMLPKNATKADQVKYKLCEKFVIYLLTHKMTQVQLAKKLKVDPSRINEIVKYRIDLYTVDKLMELAERLGIDSTVSVATPIKLKKGTKLKEHNPDVFLKNRKSIAKALSEAMLEGDVKAFKEILASHLRAISKDELSQITGVSRATVFRILDEKSNPTFQNVLKVVKALKIA